jgi:hypothetical protein
MAKVEANKAAIAESRDSIDLGNATEKTLGNTSAGVHEPLGPKRYRTF